MIDSLIALIVFVIAIKIIYEVASCALRMFVILLALGIMYYLLV